MSSPLLNIGDVVSFNIYPTSFYQLNQTDLTYQGDMGARLCSRFGIDPVFEWERAYPSLPDGVVDDPDVYPWYVFTTINGQEIVINEAWINKSTLTNSGNTVVWVTETKGNNLTPEFIAKALSSVGVEILRTYQKGSS